MTQAKLIALGAADLHLMQTMLLYGFPEAISEEEVEVQVSIPTLVLHAGQSESAIEKSIADLVSVGLVRRVRRQNTSSLSYLYRQPGCWDGPPAEETVPRQGAIRTMRARTARKAAPERLMMSVPFQPNQIRSAEGRPISPLSPHESAAEEKPKPECRSLEEESARQLPAQTKPVQASCVPSVPEKQKATAPKPRSSVQGRA